jgi:hypothetical protein
MHPTSPISFHNVEGMFDWCNRPKWSTFSNIQAIDSSRVHIPRTTMGGPWFFFSENTCKWADHGSARDDSQVGRHEEGALLSTMSQCGTATSTTATSEPVASLPKDSPQTMGFIRKQVLLWSAGAPRTSCQCAGATMTLVLEHQGPSTMAM